ALEKSAHGATLSYASFLKHLEHLIDKANFRRPMRSRNAVLVCGADLAPNESIGEIYVAGLTEGEFPRRGGQKGFLNNEEVAKWASFGIDIHNPRFHPAFETALFSSLVERARSQAHLSCPLYGLDGDELVPSFLFSNGDAELLDKIPVKDVF